MKRDMRASVPSVTPAPAADQSFFSLAGEPRLPHHRGDHRYRP